jgi:uncharacterized protein (TIGR02302 family)
LKQAIAPNPILSDLRWPLRLTWFGLFLERFIRAFWPAYSLAFVALASFLFGVHEYLPTAWVYGALTMLGLLGLRAMWRGARAFESPTADETIARLDQTLSGRPLSALTDAQLVGSGDAASRAVWAAHLRQMQARAKSATAPWPNLRLSDRDPNGLRLMAVIVLLAALIFGTPARLTTVPLLAGGLTRGDVATGPLWEGWVQPPSYTGKPVLYLNDLIDSASFAAPEGSQIVLRLYGAEAQVSFAQTVSEGQEMGEQPEGVRKVTLTVASSGMLKVLGASVVEWQVTMLPDAAPTLLLTEPMDSTLYGEYRQIFDAADDHAVTSGSVEVKLDLERVVRRYGLAATPDPQPETLMDLPLPISKSRDQFSETVTEDFAPHVWAGLPVRMELQVMDALGQESAPVMREVTLPKRKFFDPLAASVAEMRRDILWARSNGPRVAQLLRAAMHRPEDMQLDESGFLMLRLAMGRLEMANIDGLDATEQSLIAEALWEIALRLEEGGLNDAKARMERAQERLAEAMERGASTAEIAELMEELRDATDDYIAQLAQNAEPNPDQQAAQGQDNMSVTQDEIDALMDQIQELMEQGRVEEAQQLLEMLREMMENMQVTQGGAGSESGEGQGEGGQSMEELQETLRDQRDLSDEAFRDLQERYNPSQPSEQGRSPSSDDENAPQSGAGATAQDQQGEGGGTGEDDSDRGQAGGSQSLAERQEALRDALRQQQRDLPEGADEGAGSAIERAGRAMEEAGEALEEDNIPLALDRQSEAIEALREGMRALGPDASDNDEGQSGERRENANSDGSDGGDPLGRAAGTGGARGGDTPLGDAESPYGRARALLQELQRRGGDQTRPEVELDYLRRLMDEF